MSQIQRTLTILTSLGPPASAANYSLQAMVPYDLLSQCSAALPRPSWEPLLYYFVVILMGFIVCCVLVLAYFESDRVMAEYIRRRMRVSNGTQTFEKGKVFDLRSVTGLAGSSSVHQTSALVKSGLAGGSATFCANGRPSNAVNGHAAQLKDSSKLNHQMNHINLHKASSAALASSVNNTSTSVNGSKSFRRSLLGSVIKMVKSMTVVKYFYTLKKSPSIQHEKTVTKETGISSSAQPQGDSISVSKNTAQDLSSCNTLSTSAAESTPVLSEKSIPNNSNVSKRDKKGRLNNRRQIVTDNTQDNSNQPTDQSSRKLKENKDPSVEIVNKKSTNAMMDDFDDYPLPKVIETPDDLDDISSVKSGKDMNIVHFTVFCIAVLGT